MMTRKFGRRLFFSTVLLLAAAAFLLWEREETFVFTDQEKEVHNPQRGCYIQINSNESQRFEEIEEDGLRLVLLSFNLADYAESDIFERKLKDLEECLQEAEEYGVSVIFRAAYGFDGNCEEPAEKAFFETHICQMSEILNRYQEQIYCVQAGMLGPYGEWHHGEYLPEDDEDVAAENRLYILRMWEKYLSEDIEVNVRRPRFIREAEQAGILAGRLGFHNDGLLGSDSDLGTYDDPAMDTGEEMQWMDKNLKYQRNGGEMPSDTEYNDGEAADEAFRKMHISYLNLGYNHEIFEKWDGQTIRNGTEECNAETYIRNRLGYRLNVTELKIKYRYLPSKVQIIFKFCGEGYAPLPKNYRLYFVAAEEGGTDFQQIPEQGIRALCCGEDKEIVMELDADKEWREKLSDGRLRLGLKIAENAEETDSRKCVELGNNGVVFEDGINYFKVYIN